MSSQFVELDVYVYPDKVPAWSYQLPCSVSTSQQRNQGGSDTKKEGTSTQPGGSNGNHGKSDVPSTTFTVVTVPTTIQTIMNGVSAQILTVVQVTSALGAGNNADSAPAPSSTADADPHAGVAQPPPPGSGAHPHAAPTDAPYGATAWQSTEPSRSGLTSKPMLPAKNTPVTSSTSSRPPVVTAGVPGLVGSGGMRVAFFVFALAALL
ncbi:hypothetical protein INS49_004256 [Diaporthe citri]|uniref:uncharacterized protein n=1 Tax=Diaporthe citri TaxID=83186 RepID=UPI001C7EEDDD|nr:uncharacterized protein INS49_004256 [Diaporthe citri]KAG6355175.1 hypothetical protein INS49_004256 [Diaporthe citri]